jgi:hypothetical protein
MPDYPSLSTLGGALRSYGSQIGNFPVTTTTGVTITPQDVNRGLSLGTAFSGGGLSTGQDLEKILGAAVKYRGNIYSGLNHFEATRAAAKANDIPFRKTADINTAIDAMDDSTGFLTNLGRYVGREEAADIASKASQLRRPLKTPELGAEDLIRRGSR